MSKIPNWDSTLSYMSSQNIPYAPLFLFPSIFIEVIGGLCLLLGFQTQIASMVLFLYLIPVTLLMHNFWAIQGMDRQIQLVNFMKNLAILGGLSSLFANGAGSLSIDYWRAQKRRVPPEQKRDHLRAV